MAKDKEAAEEPTPVAAESRAAAASGPLPAVELLDADLRRIAKVIGIMIIVAGALVAFTLAWPFIDILIRTVLPFLVALVLAYIFNPIVNFFQQRLRLSRIGGVLFLYLVFACAVTGFFAMILPTLVDQIQRAYIGISSFIQEQLARSPQAEVIYGRVATWLSEQGLELREIVVRALQSQGLREAAGTAAGTGFRVVGDALAFVYGIVANTIGIVVALTFVVLVNIYLLLDFSKLRGVMEVMIPSRHQPRTFEVLGKLDVAVGGFLRGILITAFLVGLLQFLGLTLLGLQEYALLIGIVAGVGNLVPYLGPIAGGAPALLYVLFADKYEDERLLYLFLVLLVVVTVQMLEGFVFQPKIVGKSAQLHPIAVLFALALGANFGLLGMIVAVPAACVVRVLFKEFYWDRRQDAWEKRTGRRSLEPALAGPRRRGSRGEKK